MAAPAADLREWIALLEREGELVRVKAEVDPDLVITAITARGVSDEMNSRSTFWSERSAARRMQA